MRFFLGLLLLCRPVSAADRFLLVWAGDADRRQEDFLAVVDVRRDSRTFGKVLRTVPVGSKANEPHHLDYTLRGNGELWASGLLTGRTFVFDISKVPEVKLLRVDEPTAQRMHTPPHSYALLPDGRTLATAMDMRMHGDGSAPAAHHAQAPPGGDPESGALLEFEREGRFLRQISARDSAASDTLISPYSLAVQPRLDRILTTNEAHGYLPTSRQFRPGNSVQLWRLSDLKLLKTIRLPEGPRGKENLGPFEPRLAHAAGSQTIFVNSDSGDALFVSDNLGAPEPTFRLVYDFGKSAGVGVPALTRDDRYYLQPLRRANKLVVLEVSNPRRPRLVSELPFDRDPAKPQRQREGRPHYTTLDSENQRAAVSDYTIQVPTLYLDGDRRVYLLDFDAKSARVAFDLRFRDEVTGEVGLDFNRET